MSRRVFLMGVGLALIALALAFTDWALSLRPPIWLLLAVPLGVSLLLWQLPARFLQGLRAVILLLVLLALAGLALRLPSRAGTVIVVADRSLSMPADADELQKRDIGLI